MEKLRRFSDRRSYKTAMLFVYGLGGAFICAFALYLFLTFWPSGWLGIFDTIEVYNNPVPVLNDAPVRIGEALFYESHFCKHTNAPATTLRTLEGADPKLNKLVVPASPVGGTAPKSEYGDIKFRVDESGNKIFDYPCNEQNPQVRQSGGFIIPPNVPAGVYRLRITSRYQVNPIREIPYQITTQEFIVEDGATRNPAPRPRALSITPPPTQQVTSIDGQAEAVLEPVVPPKAEVSTDTPKTEEPTASVKIDTPVAKVETEVKKFPLIPSNIIPPITVKDKPQICLPLIGCNKS